MSAEKQKSTSENETHKSPKIYMQLVLLEDLQDVGIESGKISQLGEIDLITITHNILLHLNRDVFPDELKRQVHKLLGERENNQTGSSHTD